MKLLKYYGVYFLISALVIGAGLISLAVNGLRLGIDFTGGSLLEIQISQPTSQSITVAEVQQAAATNFELSQVTTSGTNQFLLRGKSLTNDQKNLVEASLGQLGQIKELRFETVGPTLGKELLQKTLAALVVVSVIITWFVARQFHELKYGVSAILAMFHDTLVVVGSFSLLGWIFGVEVDVLFVTALLTTLSFSVHDTIVVFDRIRELHRKHPNVLLRELADMAVLETMGRSLNNSLTIIFMLLALVLMGGETIRWFAVALLIGSVTGTYSSPFIAVPLLLEWDKWITGRRA
ncbi:MAG TPA: protein translocase subunit SecF [Candidatus Pacebacteria bacterium]|nr:protein translocase subunit SecF [Candidatus Paceibacterota bacterium]